MAGEENGKFQFSMCESDREMRKNMIQLRGIIYGQPIKNIYHCSKQDLGETYFLLSNEYSRYLDREIDLFFVLGITHVGRTCSY